MHPKSILFALIYSLVVTCCPVCAGTPPDLLKLVKDGKAECKLVVIKDGNSDPILNLAASQITGTIKQWGGVELATSALNETSTKLPIEPSIVLSTLDALKKCAPDFVTAHKDVAQAANIDEQGFVFVPLVDGNTRQLFIVSQTARGVHNGAIYLTDFCIDGTRENLNAESKPLVRSPWMRGRSAYTLTIWRQESRYTAVDWETEFNGFARDGIDRIYFWVSGHFPSQKFPQTYKCKDVQDEKLFDSTADTAIGTVSDLKSIIRSAHKLGLRIYLGGGLGGWCGTQFLTNLEPATMKSGQKEPTLCPSHPKSRAALVDYYHELFAALPEADGLFIESADEAGECRCSQCSHPIDDFGSRQFGQSQLTLCQEIMNAVWRDHPHARFAYTIGYPEHAKDVAYYNLIQQLSTDPRVEWMEARGSWTFPGPGGESRSASFFSNRVMRWQEYYKYPLDVVIAEANRIKKDGMYGMSIGFEPGFATGSFYNDIPFPMDILPYVLTGFIFREATWNPALTVEEMHVQTQKRFFGQSAPQVLDDDLWKLREIIRTRKGLDQLSTIEQHIAQAQSNASPKTAQGLTIMTRAVNDIHKYLDKKRPKIESAK